MRIHIESDLLSITQGFAVLHDVATVVDASASVSVVGAVLHVVVVALSPLAAVVVCRGAAIQYTS
jgi:hypothetical protein